MWKKVADVFSREEEGRCGVMSQFLIEVDENAIKEQIAGILNTVLNQELRARYSDTGREISSAVKDLIYSQKDRIIEMVVDRAAAEIVRKGLPKLMDKMIGGVE